jgi:hypothetical protein
MLPGMVYRKPFPVPEIKFTDHHTAVNMVLKPSSGEKLDSGPALAIGLFQQV